MIETEYLKAVLTETYPIIIVMAIIAIPLLSWLSRKKVDEVMTNYHNSLEEPHQPQETSKREEYIQAHNDTDFYPEH